MHARSGFSAVIFLSIQCDISILYPHLKMKAVRSTETSGDSDPAAQRYPSVLLILLLMGCVLDDLGSNPDREKKFSLLHNVHSAPCSTTIGALLPQLERPGRDNKYQLPYSAGVKKGWSCTSTSLTCLRHVYKDAFTCTFTCARTFIYVSYNDAVNISDFMT